MKINIITKHASHNFGAMLQAWALMTTLKREGQDCKILNYRPFKNKLFPPNKFFRKIVSNILILLHYKSIKTGFDRFESFIDEEYDLTEEYTKYSQLENRTDRPDIYITGSDQVWNPNAIQKEYFLDFVDDSSIKMSYAASMGVSELPQYCQESYKIYLDRFDYISVREDSAKYAIDNLNEGYNVSLNIDPVFLIDKDRWKKLQNKYNVEGGYILCYILFRPDWLNEWLKKLHKDTGKKIVVISTKPVHTTYANQYVHDAGPKEFLGLINGADCIISSSFHGVALSIANHKPFYAVINPNMPARIMQILNTFGLTDRIINDTIVPDFSDIDYERVEKIRLKEKQKSLDYLKKALTIKREEKPMPETIAEVGIKCTGCGVCKLVCPKNAITMAVDEEGFKYPRIDSVKCVNCGICVKNCHACTKCEDGSKVEKIYYGKHNNEKIRYNSSSGGAFTAFAEPVLKSGGLVVGAVFDKEEKKIRHMSSDVVSLDDIRRSKYVESDLGDIFSEIKTALDKGRRVLFCGTPCQAAGLKRFIGDNDNLIICDFLCHGVPSGKVFEDYINYLERNKKDKIIDYRFRTKNFGWSQYGVEIEYQRKGVVNTVGRCEFNYVSGMLDDLFLRKSCYMCDKATRHEADLTIGDFWGVFKYDSSLNDNKGISVVIANTKKGEKLLSDVGETLNLHQIPVDAIDYALKPKKNTDKLKRRNYMFREYNRLGISEFIKKYYKKRLLINRIVFVAKHKIFKC